MKKILLLLSILMMMPVLTLAHTGLESSNPAADSEVADNIERITLTFNSAIQEGSMMTLFDASEQPIPVQQIGIEENIMNGHLEQPLANGEYTVKWDIISADSHPVSGEFSFLVNAEEVAEEPEEAVENQVEEEAPKETEEQGSNNFGVLIIGVVLIAILIFVLIFRRKKTK